LLFVGADRRSDLDGSLNIADAHTAIWFLHDNLARLRLRERDAILSIPNPTLDPGELG
jgi:hypothetical protein